MHLKRKLSTTAYHFPKCHFCNIIYSGQPITVKDLMKFMTGSPMVPPLGLPSKVQVEFIHSCESSCSCKPTVSTCSLSIRIAVHYNTTEKMLAVLKDAFSLSEGFDDV